MHSVQIMALTNQRRHAGGDIISIDLIIFSVASPPCHRHLRWCRDITTELRTVQAFTCAYSVFTASLGESRASSLPVHRPARMPFLASSLQCIGYGLSRSLSHQTFPRHTPAFEVFLNLIQKVHPLVLLPFFSCLDPPSFPVSAFVAPKVPFLIFCASVVVPASSE